MLERSEEKSTPPPSHAIFRGMKASPQAVFFVNLWPEPLSSAAGVRTLELGRFIQRLGYELIGVSPSAPSTYSESWDIRTLTCDPNSSEAAEVLKTLFPDLVVYDRFYSEEKFGWRAREMWPDALQMIDTIDLHFLRGARQRAHVAGADVAVPDPNFFGDDFLREMGSLHRADVCLVVSSYEAEWLERSGFESNRVCYLPFSSHAESNLKPFADRHGFCFIGNYMHAPNVDAVRWLETELWPALRSRMPGAELHLYGAYPPQSISQLSGKNGITSHGFVEDHRAAISQHRVMLAPLRFGAGIKGKVLEAWATGTPVLGTPLAFESMGSGFAEFTTANEFVEQALCFETSKFWQTNVSRGLAVLSSDYDSEKIFKTFADFMAASRANLAEFRRSLTGRLLRHHGAQSLKYFSKWIEEKNKNRAAVSP